MSTGEEVNDEIEALRTQLRERLGQLGINEAILVDDNLVRSLDQGRWDQIIESLGNDAADCLDSVRRVVRLRGTGNIEAVPDEEIQPEIFEIVRGSGTDLAKSLLDALPFREGALDRLHKHLEALGLTVHCYSQITAAEPKRDGKLYFLDYRMDPEDKNPGRHASDLLTQLLHSAGESEEIPAAVLMHRETGPPLTRPEWEEVARGAGYYRFNFRYLNKSTLDRGRNGFVFFLKELAEAIPIGREYLQQLRALKTTAKEATQRTLGKIMLLTPAEFGIFAQKYLEDDIGRKATKHVLELFLGLLDVEIRKDAALEKSFRDFASSLREKPKLASSDSESRVFHDLHTELLYDRSDWVLRGPHDFGDIYHKPPYKENYYLLMTPECDLEPRFIPASKAWTPKATDMLLLLGKVSSQRPSGKEEDTIPMPFASEKGKDQQWIYWQVRRPLIIPFAELPSPKKDDGKDSKPTTDSGVWPAEFYFYAGRHKWHRWGRLRHNEAEHIQQRFVSDLASVGLENVSGKSMLQSASVYDMRRQKGKKFVANIELAVIPNPEKPNQPYFAFVEGCEEKLCTDDTSVAIFKWETLFELRHYLPKDRFREKCAPHNVYLTEPDTDRYYIVRSDDEKIAVTWKPPAKEIPNAQPQENAKTGPD